MLKGNAPLDLWCTHTHHSFGCAVSKAFLYRERYGATITVCAAITKQLSAIYHVTSILGILHAAVMVSNWCTVWYVHMELCCSGMDGSAEDNSMEVLLQSDVEVLILHSLCMLSSLSFYRSWQWVFQTPLRKFLSQNQTHHFWKWSSSWMHLWVVWRGCICSLYVCAHAHVRMYICTVVSGFLVLFTLELQSLTCWLPLEFPWVVAVCNVQTGLDSLKRLCAKQREECMWTHTAVNHPAIPVRYIHTYTHMYNK